jgi:myo-inositol 2-dehydrogenase / D-chiro-inositol 1-dehydrogenase
MTTRHVRKISRRDTLKRMLGAAAAPMFVPGRLLGADAPSKRITLGFIGMGSQGTQNNLVNFLAQDDAQVLAVCDVFRSRSEAAQRMVHERYHNTDCKSYTDFRRIIEDKSIDAAVISTPDHWHVPMSLMALEAGKDVFCEKPTKTIAEGRALVDLAARRKAVFQIGLEDRSVPHYHKMVEWLRNGAIGDLQRVEVELPEGDVLPNQAEAPVPKDLDYNLFVGPAEFIPYRPIIVAGNNWRMVRNFGSGPLLDWGSHQFDTAQLAVNAPEICALEAEGTGEIPKNSLTNVIIKYDVHFRYSNGIVVHVKSGGTGIRLIGSKGWVGNAAWRDRLQASDEKILHTTYTPETSKHWPMPPGEQRDFLDCVKSRKPTTYTAQTMHMLHLSLHMGYLSILLGRKLQWDAAKEEFINDPEANQLRSYTYRDWQHA